MAEFKVVCIKCKKSFLSTDEADFDGEGFCSDCEANNKIIAEQVDAQIATKRANRTNNAVFPNVYQEMRSNPKTRNKSTVQYMNIPR